MFILRTKNKNVKSHSNPKIYTRIYIYIYKQSPSHNFYDLFCLRPCDCDGHIFLNHYYLCTFQPIASS